MQAFLASDVVYAQRVAPLIKDALDKNDVKGQQIAGSRFMTDVSWLAPATVASHLGRSASTGSLRDVRPGRRPACTATGWLSTSIGAVTLQPEAPGVVNRVPWSSQPDDHGQVRQPGRQRRVQRQGLGLGQARRRARPSRSTKTIGQTKAKQTSTVNIPLGAAPPANAPTTVTVAIAKVPGEKTTSNNRSSYTVIFTR